MFHLSNGYFYHTVTKGISSNLMKASAVRRRGKAEIRESKLREAQEKREVEERLAQLEQLEQELRTAKAKVQRAEPLASTAE